MADLAFNSGFSNCSPCFSYQLLTARAHNDWTAVLWLTLHCTERTQSQSQSHIATDGQSVSQWGSWPDNYYCLTITVLFLCGALSDERTCLSFIYAAGPCQRSLSRIRVPWYSRSHLTASYLRLPSSSPPTTRRVTVEVFDPASTRVWTDSH
jgi:hypothetical protein